MHVCVQDTVMFVAIKKETCRIYESTHKKQNNHQPAPDNDLKIMYLHEVQSMID